MLHAQVPGAIFDAAVPVINPMDPNGDGYITQSGGAFTAALDETQFELPFIPFQQFHDESPADNHQDSHCKSYELVDDVPGNAKAAYFYFSDPDGIAGSGDELMLFRIRAATFTGSSSTFAILIDTDYRFGFSGPEADPNAVAGNPGFEREISVFTNTGTSGGVRVLNVDGLPKDGPQIFHAPVSSHFQVSRALNTGSQCADAPAFIDFYVPFSTLGVSASTQLRMAAAANNNLVSSLGGGAVDIAGVDGNIITGNDAQFTAVIGNFSPVIVTNPLNQAPVAPNVSTSLNENTATGSAVHTVTASDANGETLTYSITAGNTLSAFAIDATTGHITVNNGAALDFETSPSFTLLVRVSDGQLYDNAIITVNLLNVNEPPSGIDAAITIDENVIVGSSVHFVEASDPDANTALQYSITDSSPSGPFVINSNTGEISVVNAALLDFESTPEFTMAINITDGTLSDDITVKVSLRDVNEPPIISAGNSSVDEHLAAGSPVLSIAGTDPDAGAILHFSITGGNPGSAFAIDEFSGLVTIENSVALDFETNPVFALNVRVSDGTLFSEGIAMVSLKDINEPPQLADVSVTVERRLFDQDLIYTVVAHDPDAGDVLSYTINSGNANDLLALDAQTGAISIVEARRFTLDPRTFDLEVIATDRAGLSATAWIRIEIIRVADRDDVRPRKGFSPDGNDNNDYWFIEGIEAFPDNDIQVFNRWGVPVFEAHGYDNARQAWRGEGASSGAENTYFFIIRIGELEPITGYVIVKP